jgi:hypothetical protein
MGLQCTDLKSGSYHAFKIFTTRDDEEWIIFFSAKTGDLELFISNAKDQKTMG